MPSSRDAPHRKLLLALDREQVVRSPGWWAAFCDVDRGVFVPEFFIPKPDGPGWVLISRENGRDWRTGVYSLDALVTQVGGVNAPTARPSEHAHPQGLPSSSSSSPALMAAMLEALDVTSGHRVLEIGTGTGYNTALLCHRLGSDRVASVDIDPVLVERARSRLARCGYAPTVAVGDGRAGLPSNGPDGRYDRVLATVAVSTIPPAWVEQTHPGGTVLAALDRAGALALMTVSDDIAAPATGRILPIDGRFMSARSTGPLALPPPVPFRDAHDAPTRDSALPVEVVTDPAHPFEFFATLHTGPLTVTGFAPEDPSQSRQTWLTAPDGSWACHTTPSEESTTASGAAFTVSEGGPSLIWSTIEHAHRLWRAHGEPTRGRFGITTWRNHTTTVWLDHPDTTVYVALDDT